MTYERFLKIGLWLQKQDKVIFNLYKQKIDLLEFAEPYSIVVAELIKEVYGESGYDWWSWFCYEADFGTKDFSKSNCYIRDKKGNMVLTHKKGESRWGAIDEKGNPICYSWESLYEYLEKNHKRI